MSHLNTSLSANICHVKRLVFSFLKIYSLVHIFLTTCMKDIRIAKEQRAHITALYSTMQTYRSDLKQLTALGTG